MTKSTSCRKTIVSNAARDLVKVLEQRGITCILVQEMAAYLQGSKAVPKDVKLVISPQTEGTLSKDSVARYLVDQHPAKFRLRQRKNKTDVLSYYDSTILPPKKTHCDFELISVSTPRPPEYRPELVRRAEGLPVISLFSIAMDLLQELLSQYDSTTVKSDFLRRPPKKLYQRLRLLLPSFNSTFHAPTDKSFRIEALDCFLRASSIFPDLASGLWPLIRACRNFKPNVRLSHPNGTPVVDVTQLLHKLDLSAEDRNDHHTDTPLRPSEISPAVKSAIIVQPKPITVPEPVPVSPSSPVYTNDAHLRTDIICMVARKVVDILGQAGIGSALFGSLACYLYGNTRAPNDIDIMALPPVGRFVTAEWVKQAIANGDAEHFRLEAAKNPNATYRVLYYLVDSELAPSNTFHRDKCKIDVLLPGTMHLPSLSAYDVKWKGGFPVIPFSVLLLQKLQGWDDHRRMPEPYKFEKHITDASDVQTLLKLEHIVALRFSRPWNNHNLFDEEFINLSASRVKEFTAMYPTSQDDWVRLGFDI
ncbi:hypothetical protein CPB84DRAFT_153104 [Gymnopilus junonius]|uniref:Uncharacterized protein n=1 Tax=Gymnopilus junonius TaxID=109634 RepID=A0A9P5NH26_GYMJU|nr:hypothetical protein CPB84DRAFT_153104 [Gymnopilus junonius]